MASVASRFEDMLKNITPSESQIDKAIKTHTYMREQLETRRKWIKETFLTGSYKRGTAINPLHDIDCFCVVDSGWAKDKTPAQIQTEVQNVLREIYPRTTVRKQTHSLGVVFSSQNIGYDVIPAVQVEDHLYKIIHVESGDGIFILSNPDAVERKKVKANSEGGPSGRMLDMIRLLKHWNAKNGKKVKNFHLELLCYSAASRLSSCGNNREACCHLFKFLSSEVLKDCFVPGVPKYDVDATQQNNLKSTRTASQLRDFAEGLAAEARRTSIAVSLEATNPVEAHTIWQTLFGSDVY